MHMQTDDGLLIMPDTGASGYLEMRSRLAELLLESPVQVSNSWQSVTTDDHLHDTHELRNVTVWYPMPQTMQSAQQLIKPDLPWAEAHFQERVGGEPINPGVEHANWPYHGASAALHLREQSDEIIYDHNYMERMWASKLLRKGFSCTCGEDDHESWCAAKFPGYRFDVGDLADVVKQLRKDSTTRQAYLPIWFPEDTGATQGQRVPCSLGYHFMIRDNKLHVQYALRSCEVYRHFTNDVYMAVRLGQWVRDQLEPEDDWDYDPPRMGQLTMQIASFHGFVGDVSKIEDLIND